MRDFTPEQLQERFERLPAHLQEAISSADIHDKIKSIGDKNGLMLDQQGELVDQIGLVMLGLARSSTFVKDTASRLGIPEQKAQQIASDVNSEIFDAIKENMRENEEKMETETAREDNLSSLERAGGFTIERDEVAHEKASANAILSTEKNRINLLADVENPQPSKEESFPKPVTPPPPAPVPQQQPQTQPHRETLAEELLKAPRKTAAPEQQPQQQPASQTPEPPADLPTGDPYREPIK